MVGRAVPGPAIVVPKGVADPMVHRQVKDAVPKAGAVAGRMDVGRGSWSQRGPWPEGRGPRSAGWTGWPTRPPNPERLFNRFDENKDGSLSKDEFKALTDFMREHRPMGPPMMGRGGRGFGPRLRWPAAAWRFRAPRWRRASTRLVARRTARTAAGTRRSAPAGRFTGRR